MMKPNPIMFGILVLILAACSNKEESAPAAVTESRQTSAEQPAKATSSVTQSAVNVENAATGMESHADSTAQLQQPVVEESKGSTAESAVLSKAAALELANKSGCLACHSVEKKVVGPAWQDVGARYRGDPGVKTRLIDKVKKGGKGNWTVVTGGVPMPPYSPRVSDDTIEKLVTFVLSLP